MKLLTALKKIIPNGFKHKLKVFFKITEEAKKIKQVRYIQKKQIEKLKTKNSITIVFLVIHDSIWKYEELYKLFIKSKRYNPIVAIIPWVKDKTPSMMVYNQTKSYLKENNYNIFETYDVITKEWLDIKELLNPDVIFFTNPHKLTFDKYYIHNFLDKLTCYVPYAFVVVGDIKIHYGQEIFQLLWKYYVETIQHKNYAKCFTKYNINNVFISGYPGLDEIYNKEFKPNSPWKNYDKRAVKIIWAPHHTIKGFDANLSYSNFLENAEFILNLLKERDDIQIAFKPHPILKENLYKLKEWGKVKTDTYFSSWDLLPNGQLNDGPYIDLFYYSNALILDSASFIAEYLFFNKPCFFTMKDENVKFRFNSFGQMIFNYLYKGNSQKELINFIDDIVIDDNDYLKEKRQKFFVNKIKPNSNKTASQNIYQNLNKILS